MPEPGRYRVALDSDAWDFGGPGRVGHDVDHFSAVRASRPPWFCDFNQGVLSFQSRQQGAGAAGRGRLGHDVDHSTAVRMGCHDQNAQVACSSYVWPDLQMRLACSTPHVCCSELSSVPRFLAAEPPLPPTSPPCSRRALRRTLMPSTTTAASSCMCCPRPAPWWPTARCAARLSTCRAVRGLGGRQQQQRRACAALAHRHTLPCSNMPSALTSVCGCMSSTPLHQPPLPHSVRLAGQRGGGGGTGGGPAAGRGAVQGGPAPRGAGHQGGRQQQQRQQLVEAALPLRPAASLQL